MQYDEIRYVPEAEDPSITIETRDLVAKIIDNTGLLIPVNPHATAFFSKYGTNSPLPFSHHLGYHGIRTLYDKTEKRNVVIPLASWLNLQGSVFEGIENDPVDERAWAGRGRGWPIRLEARGAGAILTIDPLPNTRFTYSIEFQPAEPNAVDFTVRFVFGKRPESGPVRYSAGWPCYISGYDDVRFFYPQGDSPDKWQWAALGELPDIVIGEAVGYKHKQTAYSAQRQAIPLGYGRIGSRVLVMMFDDPRVQFFMAEAGGHLSVSPVQNPAWDFKWTIDDYPRNEPVGFRGRLVYTTFESEDAVFELYRQWKSGHNVG